MHPESDELENRWSPKDWDHAPVRLEKILDIVWRWDLYPRSRIKGGEGIRGHVVNKEYYVDITVAKRYATAMQASAKFPPIRLGLFKGQKILIDGMHRITARELINEQYIEAKILPFDDEGQLFAEAIIANSSHGKTLSRVDLKLDIRRLRSRYKMSIRDIESICHVPASIIQKRIAHVTSIVGPGGKKYCNVKETNCNGTPKTSELAEFKNALMLIRDVAQKGCVPDNEYFHKLTEQTRKALEEMHFNKANSA